MQTDASKTACKPTKQQLHQQHSQSHQETTPWRELENPHLYTNDTPALIDQFMSRDDVLDTEDNEMDVTDDELEKLKHFCFMNQCRIIPTSL